MVHCRIMIYIKTAKKQKPSFFKVSYSGKVDEGMLAELTPAYMDMIQEALY